MKIKKIGSLCAKNKHFALMHGENGEQWLGTGSAQYKLEGLPQLTAATLPPLFDISSDKAADIRWNETGFPEAYDVSDYVSGERELVPDNISIIDDAGRILIPLHTGDGRCYLLQKKFIDVIDDDEPQYFLRRNEQSGQPYIVARSGMFIVALIMPFVDKENNLASALNVTAAQMKNTRLHDAVMEEENIDGD